MATSKQLRGKLLRLVAWIPGLTLATASSAQISGGVTYGPQLQPLWSRPGPSEVDTAANDSGQIGGHTPGRDYQIGTLRCQAGTMMVGLRIRRGDVLDSIQIGCANPQISEGRYGWDTQSLRWGASAGNRSGGDPQSAMQCDSHAILSGIQGRVVTFTRSDFAADIAIECSPLASAQQGTGLFAIGSAAASWYHPQGGVDETYVPPNVIQTVVTDPVSCRPNGGVTAVTYATSGFVVSGQRVVQAVSLFCPAYQIPALAPPSSQIRGTLSENAEVAVTMNEFVDYVRTGSPDGLKRMIDGRYPIIRNANGTTSNLRYVLTPGHSDAVIDMRHFQFVGPMGQEFGQGVEVLQGMQKQASAYQRQDFYSNALGEAFAQYNFAHPNTSYAENLSAFFGPADAPLINQAVQSAKALQ